MIILLNPSSATKVSLLTYGSAIEQNWDILFKDTKLVYRCNTFPRIPLGQLYTYDRQTILLLSPKHGLKPHLFFYMLDYVTKLNISPLLNNLNQETYSNLVSLSRIYKEL